MPTGGASSEPAHDSDTLCCQLGTRGKWLAASGKGQRWRVSGIWRRMWFQICLHSGGRAPITRVGTPQRPGKSLLDCTVQPPCGTGGETEAQAGKDLPRVLQLVRGQSQDSDLGSGGLGLQPQLCSIPGSDCNLEKGDTVPVAVSSDRVWLQQYLLHGHYHHATFCVRRRSQEDGSRVSATRARLHLCQGASLVQAFAALLPTVRSAVICQWRLPGGPSFYLIIYVLIYILLIF